MRRTSIDGIVEHRPQRNADRRGYFTETYSRRLYADLGVAADFVQDNESLSVQAGTVRGLHFQIQPSPQGKLIRCIAGALVDVVVDLRADSPTFGDHMVTRLDHAYGSQLWVPSGFAHGFCTLEPDTVISYKVTAYYDPSADRGILWSDPALGIDWPVEPDLAVLSDKDRSAPALAAFGDTTGLF